MRKYEWMLLRKEERFLLLEFEMLELELSITETILLQNDIFYNEISKRFIIELSSFEND